MDLISNYVCLCMQIAPQQSPLQNPGNEMNVIMPPISLTVFDLFR